MWLAGIDSLPQCKAPGDRYHYECIACDSKAVVFEATQECLGFKRKIRHLGRTALAQKGDAAAL
jgi:hypothetical protein